MDSVGLLPFLQINLTREREIFLQTIITKLRNIMEEFYAHQSVHRESIFKNVPTR
jgi:hypothetical protein